MAAKSRYESFVPADVQALAARMRMAPPNGFAQGPDAGPAYPEGLREHLIVEAEREQKADEARQRKLQSSSKSVIARKP